MTVSSKNGSLRVVLSDAETVKYNIDNVFFEIGSKKADRALADLLKIAIRQTGFKTDATRFLIEIFPVFDGGCEVFFTPEHGASQPRRFCAKAVIPRWSMFEFKSCNDMLSAIEMLFLEPKTRYIQSSLYRYHNACRLILSSSVSPAIIGILSGDFADRYITSSLERAATIEHGTIICDKNAVAIIGSAVCHHPFQ